MTELAGGDSASIRNLAGLLQWAAAIRPDLHIGLTGAGVPLAEAVSSGRRIAESLARSGVGPGERIALIADTSDDYFGFWIGCQFAGIAVAQINPSYPSELLEEMLRRFGPRFVAEAAPIATARAGVPVIDIAGAARGELDISPLPAGGGHVPPFGGIEASPLAVAGYMHTSGTEGVPKFCAQSHEYFLRLGRLIAGEFALSAADKVFAPLPAFHINPFGYGFIGAVTGLADHHTVTRFSASGFWRDAREHGYTVAILHGPPADILLKRRDEQSVDHRLRACFGTTEHFLAAFDIPMGMTAYGSTEAGGISHTWVWRNGETPSVPEVASRVGGRVRRDLECRLTDTGEIQLREVEAGALFSGYLIEGEVDPRRDDEGWFSTGDRGRLDEHGRLIFIERQSESVRVKGEYVPLEYVEAVMLDINGVESAAAWKREGELGDELLLYYTGRRVEAAAAKTAFARLPKFMQPAALMQIDAMPVDTGVGKVQRRRLNAATVIHAEELH